MGRCETVARTFKKRFQLIIDGKVKVKSGFGVSKFKPKHLVLDDKTEIRADAVVFATGYGGIDVALTEIIGAETTEKIRPCGGLDEDGELRSLWRDCGVEGLWIMM